MEGFENENNEYQNKINRFYQIKKDLDDFLSLTEKQQLKVLYETEIEQKKNNFLFEKEYYKNKIYNSWKDTIIDDLDIDIELCETPEQRDLWNYLKFVTTSAHTSEQTIKEFKILVKDKKTNKYLGLICLSPDIWGLDSRDKYIGWIYDNKKERIIIDNIEKPRISYLVNISCCIGLQPVSHNLNIGKLLVCIVFSRQVLELYKKKFGHYYAGVITLSLYGKGIQYDRLKEIKYIGETKGQGISHIPIPIMKEIINYVKDYYPEKFKSITKNYLNKLRVFNYFIKEDDSMKNYCLHNQKRGVYFGYTGTNNDLFFKGQQDSFNLDKTKDLYEIINWWKERWARPRWNHLKKVNRIKICFELKNMTPEEKKIEYNRQLMYKKYHSDENFRKEYLEKKRIKYLEKVSNNNLNYHERVASIEKRTISFEHIIEIIKWKNKKNNNELFIDNKMISKKKVANYLTNELKTNITETIVKNYWLGICKLQEFEFYENNSSLTYSEYLKIIEK